MSVYDYLAFLEARDSVLLTVRALAPSPVLSSMDWGEWVMEDAEFEEVLLSGVDPTLERPWQCFLRIHAGGSRLVPSKSWSWSPRGFIKTILEEDESSLLPFGSSPLHWLLQWCILLIFFLPGPSFFFLRFFFLFVLLRCCWQDAAPLWSHRIVDVLPTCSFSQAFSVYESVTGY